MKNSWFLIVNPNAGNTNFNKSWNCIQDLLKTKEIHFSFAFTQYTKHELILVDEAIKQGFRKIISVGGDGTLHHVVNGIMMQRYTKTSDIKLGVIPLGTGNDWIKTYNIPYSIEKSINIIKQENSDFQDIGYIKHGENKEEYYVNVAGIGYDGYVVNKLNSLKRFGSIAYLLSGLYGLLFYRKSNYTIKINEKIIQEKCLMVLFGLCRYSGGGMQMTKDSNPKDGLLDITIAKNLSFFDLILNLPKLYNGKIVHNKKVENYKTSSFEIIETKEDKSFIEADGELLGKGSLKVSIIPKAILFVIPN
ncbi:MAG: diacylglycerol kinase family lipid kinase [Flavobacteriaceae bacterium]